LKKLQILNLSGHTDLIFPKSIKKLSGSLINLVLSKCCNLTTENDSDLTLDRLKHLFGSRLILQ